jgi:hypothetical protein
MFANLMRDGRALAQGDRATKPRSRRCPGGAPVHFKGFCMAAAVIREDSIPSFGLLREAARRPLRAEPAQLRLGERGALRGEDWLIYSGKRLLRNVSP